VVLCLGKLNREAEERGVFLGIENRHHFHEIPDFDEIGLIMRAFKGGNIRYWHDVSHAKRLENIGLNSKKGLLEAYSGPMIGIHFHDVRELDDHLAPGQGHIGFNEIKPFMKPSIIEILEVHPKVTRDDFLKEIRFIKKRSV
jgi:sugar phosphate isomerase/epimerase